MKQKFANALLLFATALLVSMTVPGCKSRVKDSDVRTSVETSLRSNPDLSSVNVEIKDGVATLSGQVKDNAARESAESTVKGVKGVKSVNNNITVMPEAAPVEITADDPLKSSVTDAIKDHPGVTADVNDGVITLTGEINKTDLPRLMQKLNALKPKKVDNSKLIIK
jgi:hyperosmotically inducible periplasmic protein